MSTIADLLPIVRKVADRVHFLYGLEADEAFGILSLEAVEGQNEYLILLRENNIGLIETRLKNVAAMHARADRIRRIAEQCEVVYDPEYVRLFLPFFFDREDWPNGNADETSDKWAAGDAIDTALDIKRAWPRLKSWQVAAITARYLTAPDKNGQTDWDGIADIIGRVNAGSAQRAFREATVQLAVEMTASRIAEKADRDGPGSRKALSNAAAGAAIHNA